MILVIPSLELKNGNCTTGIQTTGCNQDYYNQLMENPLELCRLMRRENSKSLHILDRDSLEDSNNFININSVLYISQMIDIPVQYQLNVQAPEEVRLLLDNGIYRVITDNLIFESPIATSALIADYTNSRVAFFNKLVNRKVINPNKNCFIDFEEFVKLVKSVGGNRIILSCYDFNVGEESNLLWMKEIIEPQKIKITLMDAINSSKDLLSLNKISNFGIDSVILSKALNENIFPCQKIWRSIEEKLEK